MQSLYFAMSEPPCKLRRLCARSFDKDDDGPSDLTDVISVGDESQSMSVVSVDSSRGSPLLQPMGNDNLEDDCHNPWKLSPQQCSLAHLDIDDHDESGWDYDDYVPTPASEQASAIHECHTNPYATPAGRFVLIGPLPQQGDADAGGGPEPSECDSYHSDLSEAHRATIQGYEDLDTGRDHPRDDDDDDEGHAYEGSDYDGPSDDDTLGPSHSMAIVPYTGSPDTEPPSGEPLPPGSSSEYPIIPVTISIDGVFHLRLGPNPMIQHKHVRAQCDFYHRS